jgi:aminomethyltransferase
MPADEPRRSPLHERHLALGAKLADFGGWSMPIDYAGGGVLKEHAAVRQAVGVFDVSHLGKVAVTGEGARAFVDSCLTADLGRLQPGQAQYTLCCDDPTGGIVDDLIAYLRGDDDVFLVPNAANTAEVARRLAAAAPPGVEVADRHEDFAVLAVQGPRSPQLLAQLGLPHDHDYMSFADAGWEGTTVVVCRSGYTGEIGFEIVCPWSDAGPVWDALLARTIDLGGLPCGLGARDTLRTEMGYPLHGQDIGPTVTPVQARLGWAVGWDKPAFWGRDAMLAERAAGPARLLRGLVADDRAIPRPHMTVTAGDGTVVGEVTSGTFSPTRRVGVALALLGSQVQEGDAVLVDVRGRSAGMHVVRPPFVEASPR